MGIPDVSTTPCPVCEAVTLRIEWRLVAKPLGTYSIAGMQAKVVTTKTPFLVCDSCDLEIQGKPDD